MKDAAPPASDRLPHDAAAADGARLTITAKPSTAAIEASLVTVHPPGILPRALRAKDAPAYLGMDRSLFKELVRPHVHAIPYGRQSIAFDRVELDAVHTDCREREVTQLRWNWEWQAPELKASVFVIPGDYTKNAREEHRPVTKIYTRRGRRRGKRRPSATVR